MSYNSELQANNTDLQDILDTINALPESGGGGDVKTCTVTITVRRRSVYGLSYTAYSDGDFQAIAQYGGTVDLIGSGGTVTLENVVCGTSLLVSYGKAVIPSVAVSGGISLVASGNFYTSMTEEFCFLTPLDTATATITLNDDD